MAQFTVNAQRVDPYKDFKFRVKWDGRYVAGISRVSPLKRTTEVIRHREGGDPSSSHKSPGRTEFDAITLERGLTQDMAFHDWAGLVWNYGAGLGAEVSLATHGAIFFFASGLAVKRAHGRFPARSVAGDAVRRTKAVTRANSALTW